MSIITPAAPATISDYVRYVREQRQESYPGRSFNLGEIEAVWKTQIDPESLSILSQLTKLQLKIFQSASNNKRASFSEMQENLARVERQAEQTHLSEKLHHIFSSIIGSVDQEEFEAVISASALTINPAFQMAKGHHDSLKRAQIVLIQLRNWIDTGTNRPTENDFEDWRQQPKTLSFLALNLTGKDREKLDSSTVAEERRFLSVLNRKVDPQKIAQQINTLLKGITTVDSILKAHQLFSLLTEKEQESMIELLSDEAKACVLAKGRLRSNSSSSTLTMSDSGAELSSQESTQNTPSLRPLTSLTEEEGMDE